MLAALIADACRRRDVRAEVASAGIAAYGARPAADEAVTCMAERGLDISTHLSRHIEECDMPACDLIVCMGADQADYLAATGIPAHKLRVAAADAGGVLDPFGDDLATYRRCAAILAREAEAIAAAFADPPEDDAHTARGNV